MPLRTDENSLPVHYHRQHLAFEDYVNASAGFELLPSCVWCLKEWCFVYYLCFWLCVDDAYWSCLDEFTGEDFQPTSVCISSRRCWRCRELLPLWLKFKRWEPKWLWFIHVLLHFRFVCFCCCVAYSCVCVGFMFNYVTINFCICHLLIITRTYSHTGIFRITSAISLSKFLYLLKVSRAESVQSSTTLCCR
jgi:hypothetical protein